MTFLAVCSLFPLSGRITATVAVHQCIVVSSLVTSAGGERALPQYMGKEGAATEAVSGDTTVASKTSVE